MSIEIPKAPQLSYKYRYIMRFEKIIREAMNNIQQNDNVIQTAQQIQQADPNSPVAPQIKSKIKAIGQTTLDMLNKFHESLKKITATSNNTQTQQSQQNTSTQSNQQSTQPINNPITI